MRTSRSRGGPIARHLPHLSHSRKRLCLAHNTEAAQSLRGECYCPGVLGEGRRVGAECAPSTRYSREEMSPDMGRIMKGSL